MVCGSAAFGESGLPLLYGGGALSVFQNGHVQFPTGAGSAAASMPLSGGLTIDSFTTACGHTNATPDVVDCGRNITAALLDTSVSGGGSARTPLHPWRRKHLELLAIDTAPFALT